MVQSRLLSVAVVGIFLLASSAISMAGDWGGSYGTPDQTESHSSMESGSGATSPDQGSYESQQGVEAGKLPSGENSMSSGSESRSEDSFRTQEFQGGNSRGDIDTGP